MSDAHKHALKCGTLLAKLIKDEEIDSARRAYLAQIANEFAMLCQNASAVFDVAKAHVKGPDLQIVIDADNESEQIMKDLSALLDSFGGPRS